MELQGRIIRELGLSEGTTQQGNPWRKIEYVFGFYENPSDIYESTVVLSFMNDHVDANADFHVGDQIKVRVALRCREYPKDSGRYFNDIRCGDIVMIKPADGSQKPAGGANTSGVADNGDPAVVGPQNGQNQAQEEKNDDLPF